MFNWVKSHKIITLVVLLVVSFGVYRFAQNKKVDYTQYTV